MTAYKGDFTQSRQIVRVYNALKKNKKMDVQQIMNECFVGRRSVSRLTSELKSIGLLHVCDWKRVTTNPSSHAAVYSFGPGEDKKIEKKFKSGDVDINNSDRAKEILEFVSKRKKFMAHEITFVKASWRSELLRKLVEAGKMHICEWVVHKGNRKPVYSLGNKPSVEKPERLSAQQLSARRRHYLISTFGVEVARRITRTRKELGSERIVIDGQTVYQRRAR